MSGNVQQGGEGSQGEPLSWRAWNAPRLSQYMATGTLPAPAHVQVRKRGVVLCGRVIEAAMGREDQDSDWFKVDCYLGQLWFASNNVRACSGLDGRCTCEDPAQAAGGAPACGEAPAACAVPPGNTGTTVMEGA